MKEEKVKFRRFNIGKPRDQNVPIKIARYLGFFIRLKSFIQIKYLVS